MIQKNLIIISGTEPRILCSEVIRKNNSSMTQLIIHDTSRLSVVVLQKLYDEMQDDVKKSFLITIFFQQR